MTSKKSPVTSGASQAKPAQDGLLFPIEPEHEKPLPVEKPAPEVLLLPSHDEAKTLCTLAAQIKALAPWQWIEETDVFGVEDPDTGEIGFVSVMGHVGEYEAVAVYPGAEGIYAFIDFQCDLSATPDRLLEIPQVQLSFSEAKFLEKRDRELLKSVGLKFRGTRPQFRSYRPGFLPWFITLEEARLLIHALSQTLEMAKRFAGESVAFPTGGDDKTEPFLVRVARKDDSSLKEDHSKKEVTEPREQSSPSDIRVASRSTPNPPNPTPSSSDFAWEDQIKHIPRPQAHPVTISIDVNLLQDLKTLPLSTLQLEADLFIGPARIGKPNERPMTLYMLMLADRHSGLIFGFEALSAENSLNTMYAAVPEKVAELLWQSKVLPKQIIVRSVLLLDLLEPLERELQIQLRSANNLPAIDRAARSMTNWLSTGKM